MDWFQILVIASQLSGYPIPDDPEVIVRYQTRQWFNEVPCRGHKCSLVGWYKDDGVIYLLDSLSQEDHDMFLAHEFVHYLQDRSHRWRSGHCKDNFYREIEAYRVQGEFAQKYQHRVVFTAVSPTTCTIADWDKP